ncbi:ATP-binding protein [Aliiglaciecola sp. CAU 1673]|uniref:ATP-binding protein n=1 Tax=Aliiglaciecola sp. CAU 1673 TaxID=3032595 RepID=UPI0023DA2AA8|nr:ATP-binding protein [Aliiglaciecola sp. CAU 1673]MDF2178821.1 ATP-binding protein [Aliiglaciecola sp. CAU 1673]
MQHWSLKRRSFAAALLVLVVFVPLTALILEQAFTNSLSHSMKAQLRLQNLGLISEFEVKNGEIHMPEQLFNDRLNIPESGTYAFISMHLLPLWQSVSALHWQPPGLALPAVGEEHFDRVRINSKPYFVFSYTAQFEDKGLMFPVSFHVLESAEIFNREVQDFRYTLWYWLGIIALLLIALLILSLNGALKPIGKLETQVAEVQQGSQGRLSGHYPPELEKLKDSLNHLLDSEQHQRQRYHNSLGDLAHNLKTPLAVLKSLEELPSSANEPIAQIEHIIGRQLKRAVAGAGSGWQQAVALSPLLEKLIRAMTKVHGAKHLKIDLTDAQALSLHADETDLMELFGNLLDNACKAAKGRVRVTLSQQQDQSRIEIEDDGPGIPPQERQQILARGKRLDSYESGQGLGMAIVWDLIGAYQGQLDIQDSDLGGARIIVRFYSR